MNTEQILEEYQAGKLLLIDKPLEWTSFDVVNKIRSSLRQKLGIKKIKVGHAGTLDPLASGLLLVAVGKMTKQIENFMGLPKTYTGTFYMGATTPSYDRETKVDATKPIDYLTEANLHAAVQNFRGTIKQRPPAFSAVKKGGQKAYEKARQGEQVDLPEREVEISRFELTRITLPEADFEVQCSKGTYIRSLAHDFGQKLQVGAHLSALRRTAIGEYLVDDAQTVQGFVKNLE